jgi:hypothetical protein
MIMTADKTIQRTAVETRTIEDFKAELLIEHKRVILAFLFVGLALSFVCNTENAGIRWGGVYFVVVFYLAAAIAWWLDGWQPRLARWVSVLSLVFAVLLGNWGLALPGLAFLSVLPVILAAGLIRLSAATLVAGLETLLIFLLPRVLGIATDPLMDLLAGLAIWMTWGILRAV